MAKGYNPMGGVNMNSIMKQAQKMQRQLEEKQAALNEKMLEITSGGGAVKIVITGGKEIKEVVIAPEVIDPDDPQMLQDLILTAVNEAYRQAEEMSARELSSLTGGMNLPGLF